MNESEELILLVLERRDEDFFFVNGVRRSVGYSFYAFLEFYFGKKLVGIIESVTAL